LVEFFTSGRISPGAEAASRGEGAVLHAVQARRMSSTGSRAWRMPNQMVKPVEPAKNSREGAGQGQIHPQLIAFAGGLGGDEDEGAPEMVRCTAVTRMGWPRKWA
jgi:hypothetical protein